MGQDHQTSPGEDRLTRLRQQRRKRKRRQRISALITVLAIVLLTGAIILILNDGGRILAGLLGSKQEKPVQEAQHESEKFSTVTIAAVGDIAISDSLLVDARKADSYDFSPSFFGVASLLGQADLTVGNLECIFADSPYGSATSSAPAVLADTLAGLGFDLLQTANSTSILGGMSGLEDTIDVIKQAGMQPVGTFASQQARRDSGGVTVREVNGVRVAFIAFTKGLGNMSLPEHTEYAVNLLYSDYDTNYSKLNTDGIANAMAEARKQDADVIIALVHWGSEYSQEVSKAQRQIARLLYENGADAIIGTHSHLVGPLEAETVTLSDGSAKDVVTAYDLGNFYTDSTKSGAQTSLALQLTFTRNNWTGKTTLTDYSYTPLYCADLGVREPNRYQVLEIENALALYEQGYAYRVPAELYAQLKEELAALPDDLSLPDES